MKWYMEDIANYYDRALEDAINKQMTGNMPLEVLNKVIERTRGELYQIIELQHQVAKKKDGYEFTGWEKKTFMEANMEAEQIKEGITQLASDSHIVSFKEMQLMINS